MSTVADTANGADRNYWLAHRDQLFLASRIALIVTAMSFAIRGDIMGQLADPSHFDLSKTDLGYINLAAFLGFPLAMLFAGPLCDVLGMGRIMAAAFVFHAIAIVVTIFAGGFTMLFLGTLAMGIANGCVEAACNPLIATLYPDEKIKRLNGFHMWFPGGIVIGGLVAFGITEMNLGQHAWQVKMATMVIPLVIYGFMFFGKKFPSTERVAAGVSTAEMFKECTRPMFLLFVVCMFMTAITELGTEQWLPNILTLTTGVAGTGILYLCWINGLMAVGRSFAGEVVHRISPVGVLMGSALFSIIGVYTLSEATAPAVASIAATIFAVGVCYFWPTMLGVVNERFPKTGALGLAIMGGAGMFAGGLIQPIIGKVYDAKTMEVAGGTQALVDQLQKAGGDAWVRAQAAGGAAAFKVIVILPVILLCVFGAIYLYDRARGGYQKESLVSLIGEDAGEAGSSATLVRPPSA